MRGSSLLPFVLCLATLSARASDDASLALARQAFDRGEYSRAVDLLKQVAQKEPANGDAQVLLTRSYLELGQYDAAVSSGERAVAIQSKSSEYHHWLGVAYGGKADHASMLSAYPLARKTQREFETALQLDERNFPAAFALVEYDCTAPGIVGGGEDKAAPVIAKVAALDAAAGHYAAGVCRRSKKDFTAADAEFQKALDGKLKIADAVFDIGDYAASKRQADRLLAVASLGETVAPNDPRAKFYRAVGWILRKESATDAEKLLRDYARTAPPRSEYPPAAAAHYWLGALYEWQGKPDVARGEYQESLKLNPKYGAAQDALKKLGSR